MLKRLFMPIATTLALLLVAASAPAQEPPGCPAVEEGRGIPVELRFGDLVLRAQVTSEASDSVEGTRVEGRLIGCERDPRVDDLGADAGEAAVQGLAPVLRLLHDLRVGLDLGPAQDGRCVRARLEVSDNAGGMAGTAVDVPVAIEFCGLPRSRESATPP